MATHRQAALALQPVQFRRALTHPTAYVRHTATTGPGLGQHQGEGRFHTGHPGGAVGIGPDFFLQGVGGVVRGDAINHPVHQGLPQHPVILLVPQGRVHLRPGAEAAVGGAVQQQVLGRHLRGHQGCFLAAQQLGLHTGGKVQHMEPPLKPLTQPEGMAGGQQGCLRILDDGMEIRRPRLGGQQTLPPLPNPLLVLRVDGDELAPPGKHLLLHSRVTALQHPVTGSHEHLDAAGLGQGTLVVLLQYRQVGAVTTGAQEKAVMHTAHVRGPLQLGLQAGTVNGGGAGVGHLQVTGHPTPEAGPAGGDQVLLVDEARIAEMDLGIHHPRQHVVPPGVQARQVRIRRDVCSDGLDASITNDQATPQQPAIRLQYQAVVDNQMLPPPGMVLHQCRHGDRCSMANVSIIPNGCQPWMQDSLPTRGQIPPAGPGSPRACWVFWSAPPC